MILGCPRCDARLDLADGTAAKSDPKVLCPGCKHVFRLSEGQRVATPRPTAPLPRPVAAGAIPPVTGAIPRPQAPPITAAIPRPPQAVTSDVASVDRFVEFIGAAFDPNSNAPGNSGASSGPQWEVDRPDYKDTPLGLVELQDVIKRGWIHKGDLVRALGTPTWKPVSNEPALATALAFRQKQIGARLAQMARKGTHACANHSTKRATHVCLDCAKAFCLDCGSEPDSTSDPAPLCLECDGKLAPL